MTQNKKSYIGVTIGPIYKTIQLAKHTGELWASSYMFSYIMKNIIKEILKEFEDKNIKNRFIVPY
ncbi:type III-B CRISPR-associated protein Cas10/Cmr2, partial [Clostridium botulinum]|nr:type III-B CRISPR-associated protein Cas10/Cmr2 [Clostridium botulinum]